MATKKSAKDSEELLQSERNKLRYYERKRLVVSREKKNYTKLILFHGSKNWWKAVNKSAVYLTTDIAPRIKSNIQLREDDDYEFKVECVASIPNIENMTEKLKAIGISLIEEKDEIRTYLLKEPYTADQYNLLRSENDTITERAGKMALPHKLMPNLLEDIKELQHSVFWEVRKMDGATRELIGDQLAQTVIMMVVKYTKMARDMKSDAKAYLYDAMDDIETVNGLCYALDSLRTNITEKKMFEIMYFISKTRTQIIHEMKREGMKDIEKEFGGFKG